MGKNERKMAHYLQVGFSVLANWIKERSRTALTMVTLHTLISLFFSLEYIINWVGCRIQDTQRKHEHDHNFLLELDLKTVQVPERQHNDDEINNNVADGAHPALDVDVVAGSQVGAVDLQPGMVDWVALERCGEHKADAIADAEAADDKHNSTELLVRKDAQNEEQKGNFVEG